MPTKISSRKSRIHLHWHGIQADDLYAPATPDWFAQEEEIVHGAWKSDF
jgi:hypothetical protein